MFSKVNQIIKILDRFWPLRPKKYRKRERFAAKSEASIKEKFSLQYLPRISHIHRIGAIVHWPPCIKVLQLLLYRLLFNTYFFFCISKKNPFIVFLWFFIYGLSLLYIFFCCCSNWVKTTETTLTYSWCSFMKVMSIHWQREIFKYLCR